MGNFSLMILIVVLIAITLNAEGRTTEERIKDLEDEIRDMKSAEKVTLKKLKKQIKREMKKKLVPKMLKSYSKNIHQSVKRTLTQEFSKLKGNRITSSEDMLVMFNHVQGRMKVLEEENLSLKKALKRANAKFENNISEFQEKLGTSCNCHVVITNSTPPTVSSAFELDMFEHNVSPEPVAVQYSGLGNTSYANVPTKLAVLDLREDRTFNVSIDMPKFLNDDSLLIVDDEGNMTRISLSNPSVRGKMATESYVEGITYDPVSRKLFWGSNRAHHKSIFSVGLNGSDLAKLQDGKWAFSLAVDGTRRKLFVSEWSTKTVCVMNTNGQNYKMVTDYKDDGDPRNIALDTHRRLIYVSYSFSIVKMKYDGSRIKRLAEGIWMQPLTLDITSNILYYSVKRNIYKMDLSGSSNAPRFVNQLDVDLSTIVFHKNKLYIAYQSWVPPVDVLDLHGNTLTRFADVQGNSLFRLCLIPF